MLCCQKVSRWKGHNKSWNLIQAAGHNSFVALKSVIENETDSIYCVSVNCFSKLLSSVGNDHLIRHLVLVNRQNSYGAHFKFHSQVVHRRLHLPPLWCFALNYCMCWKRFLARVQNYTETSFSPYYLLGILKIFTIFATVIKFWKLQAFMDSNIIPHKWNIAKAAVSDIKQQYEHCGYEDLFCN